MTDTEADLSTLWRFPLRRGNSDDPRNGACLLDAVSWLEYGTLGDHPRCVCPVIASFGRGINDAMTDAGRQRLRVFIPRLVGTVDPPAERARAEYLAWQAIRVFAPLALDAAGRHEDAARLRVFEGSLSNAAYASAYASAYAADVQDAMIAALDGVLKIGRQSQDPDAIAYSAAVVRFAEEAAR